MSMNPLLAGLAPMHPGELLREDILPASGKTKADIARYMGISRQYLYDILNEKKPVTTTVALRLGRLFGNSPEMWMRLQQNHDLRIEGERLAEELAMIPQMAI